MGDIKTILEQLGCVVATLVYKNNFPYNYKVKFDDLSLTSGIYSNRFQAGPFSQTKKFVLIK